MLGGEVTPEYGLLTGQQVQYIHDCFPDLRIIFLIRNPIDRLWSHAQMQERLNGNPASKAVLDMATSARPRRHSDYLTTLDTWSEVFGEDRIWLGFLEDISQHPRAVLNSITDHLGAPRHDTYPRAGHMVHTGGGSTIPGPVATTLAEALGGDITRQADQLGGHARTWACMADLLTTHRPAGDLRYPLAVPELTEHLGGANVVVEPYGSDRYDHVCTPPARRRERARVEGAGRPTGPRPDATSTPGRRLGHDTHDARRNGLRHVLPADLPHSRRAISRRHGPNRERLGISARTRPVTLAGDRCCRTACTTGRLTNEPSSPSRHG